MALVPMAGTSQPSAVLKLQEWEMSTGRKCHTKAFSKTIPFVNNVASLAKDELPDLKMTSGGKGTHLKNTI